MDNRPTNRPGTPFGAAGSNESPSEQNNQNVFNMGSAVAGVPASPQASFANPLQQQLHQAQIRQHQHRLFANAQQTFQNSYIQASQQNHQSPDHRLQARFAALNFNAAGRQHHPAQQYQFTGGTQDQSGQNTPRFPGHGIFRPNSASSQARPHPQPIHNTQVRTPAAITLGGHHTPLNPHFFQQPNINRNADFTFRVPSQNSALNNTASPQINQQLGPATSIRPQPRALPGQALQLPNRTPQVSQAQPRRRFLVRRVNGVRYYQHPLSGQWIPVPQTNPAMAAPRQIPGASGLPTPNRAHPGSGQPMQHRGQPIQNQGQAGGQRVHGGQPGGQPMLTGQPTGPPPQLNARQSTNPPKRKHETGNSNDDRAASQMITPIPSESPKATAAPEPLPPYHHHPDDAAWIKKLHTMGGPDEPAQPRVCPDMEHPCGAQCNLKCGELFRQCAAYMQQNPQDRMNQVIMIYMGAMSDRNHYNWTHWLSDTENPVAKYVSSGEHPADPNHVVSGMTHDDLLNPMNPPNPDMNTTAHLMLDFITQYIDAHDLCHKPEFAGGMVHLLEDGLDHPIPGETLFTWSLGRFFIIKDNEEIRRKDQIARGVPVDPELQWNDDWPIDKNPAPDPEYPDIDQSKPHLGRYALISWTLTQRVYEENFAPDMFQDYSPHLQGTDVKGHIMQYISASLLNMRKSWAETRQKLESVIANMQKWDKDRLALPQGTWGMGRPPLPLHHRVDWLKFLAKSSNQLRPWFKNAPNAGNGVGTEVAAQVAALRNQVSATNATRLAAFRSQISVIGLGNAVNPAWAAGNTGPGVKAEAAAVMADGAGAGAVAEVKAAENAENHPFDENEDNMG